MAASAKCKDTVAPKKMETNLVEAINLTPTVGQHVFRSINPVNGRILNSVQGNNIFHVGGKDNELGPIGKVVLDKTLSGNVRSAVKLFTPPDPAVGVQNFYELRQQCLNEKKLFEDAAFPATNSLLTQQHIPNTRIKWLRPYEIVENPLFFSEGHKRFDVNQGDLGDCWLSVGAMCLTLNEVLFYKVIPPDQSFTENYAGIFHFRFWQFGDWVDVVVDDRLPTLSNNILYMHSATSNEFWSALLEKAYAKLHGSFAALEGGTPSEAMEDVTGGIAEAVDLKNSSENIATMLSHAIKLNSLCACSILADPDPSVREARLPNGLIRGHGYAITAMNLVKNTILIRIRNPWGGAEKWNGAWSDNSEEWTQISAEEKSRIGLRFSHDGEFWMSFDDFKVNFSKLEICYLGPEIMEEIKGMTGHEIFKESWKEPWRGEGKWVANRNAGGHFGNPESFSTNPQYSIKVRDADIPSWDDYYTCIVALSQKHRKEGGAKPFFIGFFVYSLERGEMQKSKEDSAFFRQEKPIVETTFHDSRENMARFRLVPGNYVLVPCTYEAGQESSFILRIFSHADIEVKEFP